MGDDSGAGGDADDAAETIARSAVPTKVVSVPLKTQLTCQFYQFPLALLGRVDQRALKTLVSRISPARVLALRGGQGVGDSDVLRKHAKESGVESWYSPRNGQSITLPVEIEELHVLVPHALVPSTVHVISRAGVVTGAAALTAATTTATTTTTAATSSAGADSNAAALDTCTVYALTGCVAPMDDPAAYGVRLSEVSASNDADIWVRLAKSAVTDEMEEKQKQMQRMDDDDDASLSVLRQKQTSVGAISVGEVNIFTLKTRLESSGIAVEYASGMLRCRSATSSGANNNEVVIYKEGDSNSFVIEGAPSAAYFAARSVLYQQFAFV